MANRIQLRRGTAAQWTASNPVLAQGEPGIETDTGKQKFGNGTSAWSSLPYSSAGPQGAPGAAGVADDASVKSLITTPGSQTAAALTATIASSGAGNFLAAASVLSGAILSIYGHSYPPIPGFYCTPGKEWPTLLAARFGMTQHNYGESGARMIEMATAAISTKLPGNTVADRHYAPGTPGVVVLECEQNDTLFGPRTAAGQLGFKHALRAFLATVTAAQRIPASAATQLPAAWTTYNTAQASGGNLLYSVADGVSIEWTGVSAPTGKVYVLTLANAGATDAASFSVSVDGVDQGITYNAAQQMEGFTSNTDGAFTYTFSPAVVAVNVPATGRHTVMVTNSVNNGYGIFIDEMLIPSATPPEVIVCLDPPVNNPPTSPENAANFATWSPVFNQHIKDVVAKFGRNVSWVDLAPGWDSMTMAATNDSNRFHPNDAGMALIEANTAPAVVNGLAKMIPIPGIR